MEAPFFLFPRHPSARGPAFYRGRARASRTSRSGRSASGPRPRELGARFVDPAQPFEQIAARARRDTGSRPVSVAGERVDHGQPAAGRRRGRPPRHGSGADRRARDVGEPARRATRCAPSRSPPASPPARDRRRSRPAAHRSRRRRRARWRAPAPPGRVRSAADPSGRDPDRAAGSPRRAGRGGRGGATRAAPSARPARVPRPRRARASPARGRGAGPPRTATGGSSPRRRSPRSPR